MIISKMCMKNASPVSPSDRPTDWHREDVLTLKTIAICFVFAFSLIEEKGKRNIALYNKSTDSSKSVNSNSSNRISSDMKGWAQSFSFLCGLLSFSSILAPTPHQYIYALLCLLGFCMWNFRKSLKNLFTDVVRRMFHYFELKPFFHFCRNNILMCACSWWYLIAVQQTYTY